jgi:hypothetical protein
MNKKLTVKQYEQSWWFDVSKVDLWRESYYDAVAEYLDMNGLEPDGVYPNVENCKAIIPYLGDRIEEWKRFPTRFFLVNDYVAHKGFHNAVAAKLTSMTREKQRAAKEAEVYQRAKEIQQQQQAEAMEIESHNQTGAPNTGTPSGTMQTRRQKFQKGPDG